MNKRTMHNNKKLSLDEIISSHADICFAAMDFSRKFDPVYEEILEPVITDSGMMPVRGDTILSAAGNIVSEIDAIIRAARVVICDITGSNPNVLIELGIACAFKRPIVLISQDEEIPFNIQARRIITYDMSQKGKALLKKDLTAALKSVIYPGESSLREMLDHMHENTTYIIYGELSEEHIRSVSPSVNREYLGRLQEKSSTATGIWDLSLAYQKICWSTGRDPARLFAVNGRRADKKILDRGNAFIFGGPGVNPFVSLLDAKLSSLYRNALSIRPQKISGELKRFRIYKGKSIYPPDQDELLDQHIDVGLVMRFPNPFSSGGMIWMAAGVRSFGTEAAVKALVTSSLINTIKTKIDITNPGTGFWSVVKARFDPGSQQLIEISIYESGRLEPAKL